MFCLDFDGFLIGDNSNLFSKKHCAELLRIILRQGRFFLRGAYLVNRKRCCSKRLIGFHSGLAEFLLSNRWWYCCIVFK
jgi:hypothetical protein